LCLDCKRSSREQPQPNGYTEQQREEVLRAYEKRSSLRGLTRTFGVARNTVVVRSPAHQQALGMDRPVPSDSSCGRLRDR